MSCNFMSCNFAGPSFSCPSFSAPSSRRLRALWLCVPPDLWRRRRRRLGT